MSLLIRVKFGDLEHPFEIDTDWNILFLKQRVCQLFSLNAEECDLYNRATRLDEYAKISSTDISENSVVLVIPRIKKNRFFVYCYECSEVNPAVLRWSCDVCRKTGFVPTDASRPERRVSGTCCASSCESTWGNLSFYCFNSVEHCPVVYLKHIHRNFDLIPCVACLSEDCDLIVTVCEQKAHSLCLSCFKDYAREYLEEGLFTLVDGLGYTLGCPAGCGDAYISDPHHFRLVGREFYSRYKELSVARYMLTQDTAICPTCGQHWDISSGSNDKMPIRAHVGSRRLSWVTCAPPAGCGTLFCPACSWQYSKDLIDRAHCHCPNQEGTILRNQSKSNFFPVWAALKMNSVECESRETIARICRPCPRCKSATEKAGGCNHMHCLFCGCDWCWICCDDWTGECQSLHWL